jgi:hypothetical protein
MAQQAVAVSHSKDPMTNQQKMVNFTRSHLLRTFPSYRHTKIAHPKNYDPVLPWSLGCQLVSMNLHSADEHLLVAEGRFRQNGSCGYVLKPPYLIESSMEAPKEEQWRIRVLRGGYLPKPEYWSVSHSRCVNPFVKITVYDSNNSKSREAHHMTTVVKCNGLNPIWDEGSGFEFAVSHPLVAMLSITVWDTSDSGVEDFIAGAALPVAHLRQGYRSVALFDSWHTRSVAFALASLLVNCEKVHWGGVHEVC